MPRYRSTLAIGSIACLLTLGNAAPSAHAEVLPDRWASPDGTSLAACSQADPCDIVTAINAAPATSVVHIESGMYGSTNSPLTTQLEADNPITIEAASPADPPVIISDATGGSSLVTYDSTVSDLVIRSSSPTTGLYLLDNSSATRVATFATDGTYGACSVDDSTLTDSVCSQTADHAAAIGLGIAGGGTIIDTLINVTAVSTGEHSVGIDSAASGSVSFDLNLTNSIIQGKQHDLSVRASDAATSTVTTEHSLYRPTTVATTDATVNGSGSNINGKAKFADVADGDFHEKHTSPSVDAGGSPTSGGTDLAGNARTLGKAPDIGAYEFLARPHVHHLKITQLDHRTATFTVMVNPEGLQTDVVLVARHKLHEVRSRVVDAGNGRTGRQLTLSFLLDPGTKYHVRARATSQAGVTQSFNKHFTT
jgi:hypothetical protein